MREIKRALCAIIALLTVFSVNASIVFADDSSYKKVDSFVADERVFVEKYTQNDGEEIPQSIFYGEVKLGDGYSMVVHTVTENGKYKLNTVSELAADYESKHENATVMMAINGGFFDGAFNNDEKLPEGALAVDGVLFDDGFSSKTNHENAFGWTADGKYTSGSIHVDATEYVMRVTEKSGERKIFSLRPDNSDLQNYGVCLYTEDGKVDGSVKFRAKTAVKDKRLSVYNEIGRINDRADSENFEVNDGEIVIVARETLSAVKALENAEKIEVYNRSTDEIFAGYDYVVDVFNDLVADGKAKAGFKGAGHATTAAPRTTIGYFDDGRVFFSVADGRQDGYAKGLTCRQQADFAAMKGCAFAYELDGGGSSTFLVRKDGELVCMNKPSEGAQRKILDAVLIVKTKDETPDIEKIVKADSINLLQGNSEAIALADGIAADKVLFVSTDERVAVVDESGVVTAIGEGACEIIVMFGDKEEKVTVTVKASKPTTGENGGCKGEINALPAAKGLLLIVAVCAILDAILKRKKA